MQTDGVPYGGLLFMNGGLYILPDDKFLCIPFVEDGNYYGIVGDIKTGETLYTLNDLLLTRVTWNEETLYVYDTDNGLLTFNISTGEPCEVPLPDTAVQNSVDMNSSSKFASNDRSSNELSIDNDGIFYTADREGLRKHEQVPQNSASVHTGGAQQSEQAPRGELLMNGLDYTFGSPLYQMNGMYTNGENGEIFIALNTFGAYGAPGDGKLMRYVWDENAIATSSDRLSIFSLYDDAAVRLALSEFKRIRPDVSLEYNTAFGRKPSSQEAQTGMQTPVAHGITPQMEEEALRTLNTQLLAGDGPDVIFLDNLPFDSFVRSGILADITDFVNEDSNIMRPIIEPMFIDGKVYAVPTNFALPILFGGSANIPVQSLDELAKAVSTGAALPEAMQIHPNASAQEEYYYMQQANAPRDIAMQPFIIPPSLENLFDALYPSSALAIFPQLNSVNTDALENFLQAMKAISDKYDLARGANNWAETRPQNTVSGSAMAFAERRARTGYDVLATTAQFSEITNLLFWSGEPMPADDGTMQEPGATIEDLQVAYEPMPGLASGVYLPAQLVGITTTAEQPDVAMLFLSTLLSDDLQANNMGAGLPVTQTAFENALTAYETSVRERQENNERFSNTRIVPDTDTLLEIIGALSTPYYENTHLRDTVFSITRQYCEGVIALDAAVSEIENATQLYFAERQ